MKTPVTRKAENARGCLFATSAVAIALGLWACSSGAQTGTSSGEPTAAEAGATQDGGAISDASRRAPDGAVCSTQNVNVPSGAASTNPSGGPAGCTEDKDCAYRIQGDYCGCPAEPRPVTQAWGIAFDEGLNGIQLGCTCSPPPACSPPPSVTAYCNAGSCAIR